MHARLGKGLVGEIDPLSEKGKGEDIAKAQKEQAASDCILKCPFGKSGLKPELRNHMLVASTGFEELGDIAHLEEIGERIVCMERALNIREGSKINGT